MEDAHIQKDHIDGLITEGGLVYPLGVAEYLGMTPRYSAGVTMMGASGGTAVITAAMAIHAGLANTVLVVIAQSREVMPPGGPPPSNATEFDGIFGSSAGAGTGYSIMYTRHMHQYGTTQEQLAHVAVNERFNALENPNSAFQGQPITHEDVLNSRYINFPLRLLESVMPCSGGAALIVTRADLAKSTSPHKPVYLLGAGVALDANTGWKHKDITVTPVIRSAPTALSMSGYSINDIQSFQFYD
jgi:acetyl-CoA acetyltransferase